MSLFNLDASLEEARKRFGESPESSRRGRSDRGTSRLPGPLAEQLRGLLLGQERPPVRELLSRLAPFCRRMDYRRPSRATVYRAMERSPGHTYEIGALPTEVRRALYNMGDEGRVSGHQVAFYCLNHGGSRALSFAAGLPWLDLYQAARTRGWRSRSRGLLDAILEVRRI